MTAMHRHPVTGPATDRQQCWRGLRATPKPLPNDRVAPQTPTEAGVHPGSSDAQSHARDAADAPSADPGSLTLNNDESAYLRTTLAGVSTREFEVLVELCAGGRNEDVAKRLFIALPTLRTHLSRLNDKLGTLSKSELVAHVGAVLVAGYRSGVLISSLSPTTTGEHR